jgi:hypothetical protein
VHRREPQSSDCHKFDVEISASDKLFRVIVLKVPHHGVDVQFVAALIALEGVFDEQAWAMNAEV